MICLRCGYCCIQLDVIIIKPEYILKPDFNNEDHFMHKENSKECPLLSWKDSKACCNIHHLPWYKKTPCFAHSQIESSKDCVCRMGEYILKKPKWIVRTGFFKTKLGATLA